MILKRAGALAARGLEEIGRRSGALFWGLFGVCAVSALWPIWGVTYLPLVDLGGHIELMDIAAHLDEPAYAERFVLEGYLGPNTITLWIASALGGWIESITLSRLMLSWYVVGLPVSFWYFCGAFGRSRWLSFFAFPLTWNHMFNFGFLNFLVGLPLFFWVAGGMRQCVRGRDGWVLLGVSVGLVGLYFCHFLVWLMAAGYVIYVWVLFAERRGWWGWLVLVPSGVLGAFWSIGQRASQSTDPAWEATKITRFKPTEDMLLDLHYSGMRLLESSADEVVVILLVIVWFVMSWGALQRPALGGWRQRLGDFSVELGALCALCVYFWLPENFGGVNVIAERVLPVLFLFWAASLRPDMAAIQSRVAVAVLVGVALYYPQVITEQFGRFEDEVIGGLAQALAQLPEHALLRYRDDTCHSWSYSNPVVELCVNYHIPRAIHSHLNRGLTSLSFAGAPTSAITWRANQAIRQPDAVFWRDHQAAPNEYILIRADHPPLEALASVEVSLLYGQDQWWLFKPIQRVDHHPIQAGGTGGAAFWWDCPEGAFLTGVDIQSENQLIYSAKPFCKQYKKGALHTLTAGPRLGGAERVPAPPLAQHKCKVSHVLIGFSGRASHLIHDLKPVCAPIKDLPKMPEAASAKGPEDPLGEPFRIVCPPGMWATGLRGRSGAVLDAIGLDCQSPSALFSGATGSADP